SQLSLMSSPATNLAFSGYYFAPTINGNRTNSAWMTTRQSLMNQGWQLEPLYLGPAAGSSFYNIQGEGSTEGQQAASYISSEGFALGSRVFLDMEFQGFSQSILNYISGWSAAVAAAHYQPGVYLSHLDANAIHGLLPDDILWTWNIPLNQPSTASGTQFYTSD